MAQASGSRIKLEIAIRVGIRTIGAIINTDMDIFDGKAIVGIDYRPFQNPKFRNRNVCVIFKNYWHVQDSTQVRRCTHRICWPR